VSRSRPTSEFVADTAKSMASKRRRMGEGTRDTPLQDAVFPKLVHHFWTKISAVQDDRSKIHFGALEIEVTGSKCFDKSLPEGATMTTRVDVVIFRTR